MTQADGEKELVLGNKQLISLFFVIVALCGVFFAGGYMIGRNTSKTATINPEGAAPAAASVGAPSPLPRSQDSEPPRETAGEEPQAPSAAPAEAPKSAQSTDEAPPKSAQSKEMAPKGEKSAQDMKGEKGAAGKDMKACGRWFPIWLV